MPTGSVDTTDYGYALKELYPEEAVVRDTYEDNPAYAMCEKDETFTGKYAVIPLVYANPPGRSKKLPVAISRSGGSKGVDFQVTRAKDYAVISIDGELAEAAASSEGAMTGLVDALEVEGAGAKDQLALAIGRDFFGDGTGSIGSIGSISTSVITLSDVSDVTHFEIGQYLVAATDSATSLHASGEAVEITGVNREVDTATVTIASTPTGWVAGSLLWNEGDYEAAGDKLAITGLAGWLPITASPAALFGATRTDDRVRKAGVRVNGQGVPLHEILVRACVQARTNGARIDRIFISPTRMEQLCNLLDSKVVYCDTEVAGVGFRGVEIVWGEGTAKVYADRNCPDSKCYGKTSKYWKFKSAGKAPKYLQRDGLIFLRHPGGEDAYQARLGYYGNVCCRAPGRNFVIYNFGS